MRPSEFDISIYKTPDALKWARFFKEQNPQSNIDEDTMYMWFSNAMGAMHDYLIDPPNQNVTYEDMWCNDNK